MQYNALKIFGKWCQIFIKINQRKISLKEILKINFSKRNIHYTEPHVIGNTALQQLHVNIDTTLFEIKSTT